MSSGLQLVGEKVIQAGTFTISQAKELYEAEALIVNSLIEQVAQIGNSTFGPFADDLAFCLASAVIVLCIYQDLKRLTAS